MPSKKKKYNARFPAGRIKKIMQTDEEVGKVAQAVPVIISRTLELFVESLLTKTLRVTNARNAKTISPSHMKQCIMSESRFDFLRELVKNIPDISLNDELLECGSPGEQTGDNSPTSAPSSPPPGCSRTTSLPNGELSNRPPPPNLQSLSTRSLDLPSTSSMNFYKESDADLVPPPLNNSQTVITSTVIQHTSNHSNNNINNNHNSNPSNNVKIKRDYSRTPKYARYDSAPCNLTINTSYNTDLSPKINTPNISISNNNNNNKPIFSIDLSKSFNSQDPNSLLNKNHLLDIPVLKIDLSSTYQHLPSTSKEIPSPPIIKSDVCSTPTVKIDYSSIALSSSPLRSPTGPALPISSPILTTIMNTPSEKLKIIPSATITSNSKTNNNSYITAKQPTPSTASIDLTNIHNNSNFTNTKNMLSSNSLEMDEDYDDL